MEYSNSLNITYENGLSLDLRQSILFEEYLDALHRHAELVSASQISKPNRRNQNIPFAVDRRLGRDRHNTLQMIPAYQLEQYIFTDS